MKLEPIPQPPSSATVSEWSQTQTQLPLVPDTIPSVPFKPTRLKAPFHRTMDRIPMPAMEAGEMFPAPGPMIEIWNNAKRIDIFAPSGVLRSKSSVQHEHCRPPPGGNSKPLAPSPCPGTPKLWLPQASECSAHRQTRSRIRTSCSAQRNQKRTPPLTVCNTPNKQQTRQASSPIRHKSACAPQMGQGQTFMSPTTKQRLSDTIGIGCERVFDLWQYARALVKDGRPVEALKFFERARSLAHGRVPTATLAHLASEIAAAALKAAQQFAGPNLQKREYFIQAEKEAKGAISELVESRSAQMKAFAHLLHATAGLELPHLESLMSSAASLLIEESSQQVLGQRTLAKALVHILYNQGRHDEAVEWKNYAQSELVPDR